MFFSGFLRLSQEQQRAFFSGEEILGLKPEEWAADIGLRSGEEAAKLIREGITKEALLLWKDARKERMGEILSKRIGRFAKSPADPK